MKHPMRCETCKTETCYHHPSKMYNELWLMVDHEPYWKFTSKYGCASHSSMAEQKPATVGIHCPRCNWHQNVEKDMWEFQSDSG